jgi:hypothetical protein
MCFFGKAHRHGSLPMEVGKIPPAEDLVARPPQHSCGRQKVALLVLVHPAMRRQKVPEIAARPGRPGEGVVDVQACRAQIGTRPDAPNRLSSVYQLL